MSDLSWTNERRKLSELIPWKRNPRQIRRDEAKRLTESVAEFGQVEPIIVGPGNELYNGQQRLRTWANEYGDIEIDVRVSSRPLTEKEREKLTVFLHRSTTGEFDFDVLANEFEVEDLLDWGFTESELGLLGEEKLSEKTEAVRAKDMFHVLISVHVDFAGDLKEAIEGIAKMPGVEIVYGANG